MGVQEEPGPVLGIGAALVMLGITSRALATSGALAATRGQWLKKQEQQCVSGRGWSSHGDCKCSFHAS